MRSGALWPEVRQPQAGRVQRQRAPALERRAFQPGQLQARRPGQPWVLQPELPQERPQGPREQQPVRGQLRLALPEWPEPQAQQEPESEWRSGFLPGLQASFPFGASA